MHKMKCKFFATCFFIFMTFILGIGHAALSASIGIQAGITVYNDPRGDGFSFVEFPFSVSRSQFSFEAAEGADYYKASISARLVLSDSANVALDSVSTLFFTRIKDLSEARDEKVKLYNVLSLHLKPGQYRAVLEVVDPIGGNKGTFVYNSIIIGPVDSVHLSLSDIELAYDITIVGDDARKAMSPLVKNGLEIIPSPMGIFSELDSNFCIYAELYNLSYSPDVVDSFSILYQIYSENGTLYFDFGEVKYPKPGTSAVITNVFNFSSWKPGKYGLRLTAIDPATGDTSESSKRLIIHPRGGFAPETSTASAPTGKYISPLDTADLATQTKWVKYLFEGTMWNMFESLNDTGKLNYIKRYFAERDPDPTTEVNEYLTDVLARFNYAVKNFSSLAKVDNGWQTDRGRILIKYGLSDDVREKVSPMVANPWIVWEYHSLQGGVYFIFEDYERYGDYRLVHSTAKGEMYSQYWADMIKNNEIELD